MTDDLRSASEPVVRLDSGVIVEGFFQRLALEALVLAWAASLVALGVVVGTLTGAERRGAIAGVLVVAVCVLVLSRVPRRVMALALAAAIGAVAVAVEPAVTAGSLACAALLVVVLLLSVSVLSRLPRTRSEPLTSMSRETLDDAAAEELTRARRYERPLAIVSMSIAPEISSGSRADDHPISEVAAKVALCLRRADVVGYAGPARLIVLLPETTGKDAIRFIVRLGAVLPIGVAEVLRVGIACFPTEEVTWVGLKSLGQERERPLREFLEQDAILVPLEAEIS
jgi:hypothetical protein